MVRAVSVASQISPVKRRLLGLVKMKLGNAGVWESTEGAEKEEETLTKRATTDATGHPPHLPFVRISASILHANL